MTAAPTILVIDDHEMLARAFSMALELEGYDVHTAYSAEHGLRLAKSERPAAIILDLQMPFINGAGFLYRLRTSPEHTQTPVMIVTGSAISPETQSELTDLQAVIRFKPLGLNELLTEVRALLTPQAA